MNQRIPRWLLLFIPVVIIALAYGFYLRHPYLQKAVYDYPLVQQATKALDDVTSAGTSGAVSVDTFLEEEDPLDTPLATGSTNVSSDEAPKESVRIQVPFMSQAPHGNWEMPYQEACEEASLILVDHYLRGEPITAEIMDQEILALVKKENEEFGYSADVTMAELAEIAEKAYGYDTQLLYEFTVDDMKRILAEGNPIIIPLAGRNLQNPYYSGEGPWYHVLVVTGYDGKNFITNDVGTKHGEGYKYPYARIYNNIHDWNMAKEDIENGKKVILVVKK